MEQLNYRTSSSEPQGQFFENYRNNLDTLRNAAIGKQVVLITGPMGVGKGSIINSLTADASLNIGRAVPSTTRSSKKGEVHDVTYHFMTDKIFGEMAAKSDFLYSAEMKDKKYGTSFQSVISVLSEGKNVVVEPPTSTALVLSRVLQEKQIRIIDILLSPIPIERLAYQDGIGEAIDILRRRIKRRNRGDIDDTIESRLQFVTDQLMHYANHMYVVENLDNNLSTAVRAIKEILLSQ